MPFETTRGAPLHAVGSHLGAAPVHSPAVQSGLVPVLVYPALHVSSHVAPEAEPAHDAYAPFATAGGSDAQALGAQVGTPLHTPTEHDGSAPALV
ncbi:MAG: hypothetical protein JNG84_01915 [Archangium sp.]|nr:hypothetical protein [Archangium sp.]